MPNRACDDGIEGPPTEPQTDGSRRTRLGARNGLQWAAHLDLLKILLPDRLDQLHSRGSEPSLYSRASSTHEPSARASHCLEPPRRRRPKPAAQRSAVLRTRLAACRAPCPAGKAPPNPAGPRQSGRAPAPVARAARAALPSSKQGSASRDGPRCPISPRVFTASGTCSPCGWNTRGSQTHGLAYVDAHPRPQCRAFLGGS